MLKKFVVPALVTLGILGASFAPLAQAQKPTPAPKMGGKMGSAKKGDKKGPERGPDGKFLKKSDKKDGDAKKGGKKGPERGPDGKFLKKGDKKSGDKMGKMSSTKKSKTSSKMSGAAGKPEWDAKLNRWRLNGKFVSEADALKMGGKK